MCDGEDVFVARAGQRVKADPTAGAVFGEDAVGDHGVEVDVEVELQALERDEW